MLKKHYFVAGIILFMALPLSACLGLPSSTLNNNGEWIAFLTLQVNPTSDDVIMQRLQVLNLQNGEVVTIGLDGDTQGAFAWHPNGSQIVYYNRTPSGAPSVKISDIPADPIGFDLFGVYALPGNFYIPQIAYSPDGNYLAMHVVLLPEDFYQDATAYLTTPDSVSSALYIADINSGTVTPVTMPGSAFITGNLAWSPDNSRVAYTIQETSTLSFSGGLPQALDEASPPALMIYDRTTNSSRQLVDEPAFSAEWLNTEELVFITRTVPEQADSTRIDIYNLNSDERRTVFDSLPNSTFLTLSLSPNKTQLVYSTTSTIDNQTDAPSSQFLLLVMPDGDPTVLYETAPDMPRANAAVWSPDQSAIFITTNPLDLFSALTAPEESPIPITQLVRIDLDDSDNPQVIYEGTIGNSGLGF